MIGYPIANSAQAIDSEATPQGSEDTKDQELFDFNFPKETEIVTIVKRISKIMNKNYIWDSKVKGKIRIIAPRPVSKDIAYQLFISSLNTLGLTTLSTGKVEKIINQKYANFHSPLHQELATLPKSDEHLTILVNLKYANAKQLATMLKKVSDSKSIIEEPSGNSIILSGSGRDLSKISKIIDFVDVKKRQSLFVAIPVKYSSASYLSQKLLDIYSGSKKNKSTSKNIRIIPFENLQMVGVIGTKEKIKSIKETMNRLDQLQKGGGRTSQFNIIPIEFVEAKSIIANIQSVVSANQKSRLSKQSHKNPMSFKATAHEETNSILLIGESEDLAKAEFIIRKLDRQQPQVFIQADILEISANHSFKINSSILAGVESNNTNILTSWEAGGIVSSAGLNQDITGESESSTPGSVYASSPGITMAALSQSGIQVGGLSLKPGALINYIKSNAETRVLSSPTLLTLNNEEASLSVGYDYFYKSNSIKDDGSYQNKLEKEVIEIGLSVTPKINESDSLTIDIDMHADEIGSITDGLPQISKRKTKQTIILKSGQTSVIAGLQTVRTLKNTSKIPFLGDIPLIGKIFSKMNNSSSEGQIVIFITPFLIRNAKDMDKLSQQKYKKYGKFLEKSQN